MRLTEETLHSLCGKASPGSYITLTLRSPVVKDSLFHEDRASFELLVVGRVKGVPEALLIRASSDNTILSTRKTESQQLDNVSLRKACLTASRIPFAASSLFLKTMFEVAAAEACIVDATVRKVGRGSNIVEWPKSLRDKYVLTVRNTSRPNALDATVLAIPEQTSPRICIPEIKTWSLQNLSYSLAGSIKPRPTSASLRRARRNRPKIDTKAVAAAAWKSPGPFMLGTLSGYSRGPLSSKMFTIQTLYNFIAAFPGDVVCIGSGGGVPSATAAAIDAGRRALVLYRSPDDSLDCIPNIYSHYRLLSLQETAYHTGAESSPVSSWWGMLTENYNMIGVHKHVNWLAQGGCIVDPVSSVSTIPFPAA